MKILLVDDTKTDRLIMSAYLDELGHDVVLGCNGLEAVDQYKRDKPDLIIMDVIMPKMDGFEAASEIRKDESDWIPIIFLSARVEPTDIASGIEAGGDDYLTKPVNYTVLVAKLKAMQRIAKMRHTLINVSNDLEQANKELECLVNVDGLTNLANRRYLDQVLQAEISRAVRYKQPLSVMLSDVDHFKLYNDNYGHLTGDDCLKSIASALKNTLRRKTDFVARYGGEEFAVVLPDTDNANAMILGEKLRKSVENLKITHEHSSVLNVVSLSIGVYTLIPVASDTPESILKNADEALYSAKTAGRNRVHCID